MTRGLSMVCWSMLLLCLLFTAVQGNPTRSDGEKSVANNRRERTFSSKLFGDNSDWSRIRENFIADLSALPMTMMSFFDNDEYHERFSKRIAELEKNQKRIIHQLRQFQASLKASACSPDSSPEHPSRIGNTTEPTAADASQDDHESEGEQKQQQQQPTTEPSKADASVTDKDILEIEDVADDEPDFRKGRPESKISASDRDEANDVFV